jgi:hypothetical protein
MLGTHGVVGVKSGATPDAGGCEVLAQNLTINGVRRRVYVAVFGQDITTSVTYAGVVAYRLASTTTHAVGANHLDDHHPQQRA